ncbi:hypothetical protein CLOM621_06920 [Clostridium sp. M62/1]|nr:hypothetical protein CLOM621_06920 [Clostridium sp. M62/1]
MDKFQDISPPFRPPVQLSFQRGGNIRQRKACQNAGGKIKQLKISVSPQTASAEIQPSNSSQTAATDKDKRVSRGRHTAIF